MKLIYYPFHLTEDSFRFVLQNFHCFAFPHFHPYIVDRIFRSEFALQIDQDGGTSLYPSVALFVQTVVDFVQEHCPPLDCPCNISQNREL